MFWVLDHCRSVDSSRLGQFVYPVYVFLCFQIKFTSGMHATLSLFPWTHPPCTALKSSVPTCPKISFIHSFPDLFALSYPFMIPLPCPTHAQVLIRPLVVYTGATDCFMSFWSPLQYSVPLGVKAVRGEGVQLSLFPFFLDITKSMSRRSKIKIDWTLPSSLEPPRP